MTATNNIPDIMDRMHLLEQANAVLIQENTAIKAENAKVQAAYHTALNENQALKDENQNLRGRVTILETKLAQAEKIITQRDADNARRDQQIAFLMPRLQIGGFDRSTQ